MKPKSSSELLKQAEAGDAKAMYQLASGLEISPDANQRAQAASWYQKAADLGYGPAQAKVKKQGSSRHSAFLASLNPGESFGRGERPLVVLVDDEPDFCDLVQTCLQDHGIRLVTFKTSDSCLEFFRSQKTPVSGVIIDYELPGINGLQLAHSIRAASETTVPILMVSGHSDPSLIISARSLQVISWIVKPFDPGQFMDAVQKMLESGSDLQQAGAGT